MGNPWFKFWAKEWSGDRELRLCSPAARGLLADIMSIAHEGEPYGFFNKKDGKPYPEDEFCITMVYKPRLYRKLLDELLLRHRIKRSDNGFYVPRLVSDNQKLEESRSYGKLGGNPNIKKNQKPKPNKPGKPPKKPVKNRFKYTESFELFWHEYPRPIGKAKAFESWNKALAEEIDEVKIVEAVKKYAISVFGKDLEFVKHPSVWLNQGCWDDIHDGEKAKKVKEERRREAYRKKYKATMAEYMNYVIEASESGRILGGGTVDDMIDRISHDIKNQLGEKGLADFLKRAEQYRKINQ